ncbi:MAG: hypothetical protein ACREAK_06455 [Nitrosarchaeum sp.]
MSKSQETNDIFTVCKQNAAKFFNEIEKSTPLYQQSIANLQQNYHEAWKNVINSSIALEQEYAAKAGLKTEITEATLKAIQDITEQAIAAYTAQNKFASDSTGSAKKAFDAFNENTKAFVTLNKNMIQLMMSAFTPKS